MKVFTYTINNGGSHPGLAIILAHSEDLAEFKLNKALRKIGIANYSDPNVYTFSLDEVMECGTQSIVHLDTGDN